MSARHVTDEEDDVFTIESVYTMDKREVRNDDAAVDPFAIDGEQVRKLNGTSRGMKRKVTNTLQKYHRSADGTVESKDISDDIDQTGYDYFQVAQPPYSMEAFAAAYELSAPHYAAVNAKVANIVGLGWSLNESKKTSRALEDLAEDAEKLKKTAKKLANAKQDLEEEIDSFNEESTFTETLIN
ncbi:MAG TPA: hypothetical protein VIJ87_13020, partial [Pyrinomonadaceae bacterium]